MSNLGRITNSFFSATNENTLALANLNLDFALVKYEAPKEFNGLGTSLSIARRNNAEDGPLHKTLRKLGCLFEQVLPSAPKLIQAYGLRTSEIIQSPGISPNGSKKHGPFEQFVGADGASIWAAATSGPAALCVNLLACMLARQFDDAKIGVAILVELVTERQREIREAMENGHIVSISTMMAAQQDISREELAAFDASARSWLRSADEAKMSCQKQLMLVLRNINTTISGGSSTYTKVMEAWKQAMVGFEDLLAGMPQEVSSGAVLRALSAWHLYPDLIVLAEKTVNVRFQDPLIPQQGVVTVGLQFKEVEPDKGIQWSLTLSHLRFYGDPVIVETYGNDSRVNIKQLRMIAFGSLLGVWNVFTEGIRDAALWFQAIWKVLQDAESKDEIAFSLPWLRMLVDTADEYIASQGDDRETCRLLVNYGRRRGKSFLTKPSEDFQPFFGLDYPHILAFVEFNIEYGIQYFREVAKALELKDYEAFIMYWETYEDGVYCEVATAVPHSTHSSKRSQDGSVKLENMHARWILSERSFPSESGLACSCQVRCERDCPCRGAGLFCNQSCHQNSKRSCQAHWLASRLRGLPESREKISLIKTRPLQDNFSSKAKEFQWRNSPVLYGSEAESSCKTNTSSEPRSIDCCRCFGICDISNGPVFVPIPGFAKGFSLCIRKSCYNENPSSSYVQPLVDRRIEVSEMLQHLSSAEMKSKRLFKYLENISPRSTIGTLTKGHSRLSMVLDEGPGNHGLSALGDEQVIGKIMIGKITIYEKRLSHGPSPFLAHEVKIPPSLIRSLGGLSIANRLYDGMTATSIPSKIVEQPLYKYQWIPQESKAKSGMLEQPSLAQAMACILTFESGGLRANTSELEPVMAISSCNSIFVAGALLSDPAEKVNGPDIRRIVGNVGKPGIALLVSPQNLMVKPPSQDFRAATHAEYDGGRLDNFSGTSLHLSFTGWKVPRGDGEYGLIDQDVFLAEAAISVRDCGRWIADIDVLNVTPEKYVIDTECDCDHQNTAFTRPYMSIDSWEELLDPPLDQGIFTAHGNWAARLAAICILKQKNMSRRAVIVGQQNDCLRCLESQVSMEYDETVILID